MKPVRLLLAALCFSALLVIRPETLFAQGRHSERAAIGNFDLRESQSAEFSARKAPAGAEAALKGQLPAVRVERHPVRGAAKFIDSPRSFLAGPEGAGVAAGAAVGALPESDGLLGRHRGLILRGPAGMEGLLPGGATIPCPCRGNRPRSLKVVGPQAAFYRTRGEEKVRKNVTNPSGSGEIGAVGRFPERSVGRQFLMK
jgi:hypothetical protein